VVIQVDRTGVGEYSFVGGALSMLLACSWEKMFRDSGPFANRHLNRHFGYTLSGARNMISAFDDDL
jgi:hypothetical protein